MFGTSFLHRPNFRVKSWIPFMNANSAIPSVITENRYPYESWNFASGGRTTSPCERLRCGQKMKMFFLHRSCAKNENQSAKLEFFWNLGPKSKALQLSEPPPLFPPMHKSYTGMHNICCGMTITFRQISKYRILCTLFQSALSGQHPEGDVKSSGWLQYTTGMRADLSVPSVAFRGGYKCDVCMRTFGRRNKCQRHMLVHTGEKPFKCSVCLQAFSRTDTLHKHRKTRHPDQHPYQCIQCDLAFPAFIDLREHTASHPDV